MTGGVTHAASVQALVAAVRGGAPVVEIAGDLRDVPTLRLAPGQVLRGAAPHASIRFAAGIDGVGLNADNALRGLTLITDAPCRAVYIDPGVAVGIRGVFALSDITATGQLQFVLDGPDHLRRLELTRVFVTGVDVRQRTERPSGNGVTCMQGAITIWNRVTAAFALDLRVDTVRIGTVAEPVRGGGLFVAGHGDRTGGEVRAGSLTVHEVHCDSGLEPGNATTIAGGVFVLPGAHVGHVHCIGSQTSIGPNAVPVDNWGVVDEWTVDGDIVTRGQNAVAIVNAGRLGRLDVRGWVETHGDGARACAIYGPVELVRLANVRTWGAAATGVHVCNHLGRLEVTGVLDIQGRAGVGMVKGKMERMQADGLHVEVGARLDAWHAPDIRVADPQGQAVRDERR